MKRGSVSVRTTPCHVIPLTDAAIICNFLGKKETAVKSNQTNSERSKVQREHFRKEQSLKWALRHFSVPK